MPADKEAFIIELQQKGMVVAMVAIPLAMGFAMASGLRPEQGIVGVDVAEWNGLFAPTGTPAPVLARLESDVRALVTGAALQRRWTDMGVQAVGSGSADFGRFLQAEATRWTRVIQTAGIRLD